MSRPNLRLVQATHATRVVDLRPRIDREAELAHLVAAHAAAIDGRHLATHSGDRHYCPDPVCESWSAFQTAVR